MSFIANLIQQSAAKIKTEFSAEMASVDLSLIEVELQAILEDLLPSQLTLATTTPDFESVMFQLMQALESSNSWNDVAVAATGQMFMRAVAADVAYTQFSIVRAVAETNAHTATNPNSVYSRVRAAGVRLTRNQPQIISTEIERADMLDFGYLIPKWTEFEINGVNYFNREEVAYSPRVIKQIATLTQGTLNSATLTSTGAAYQTIEIGSEDWRISNIDIRVIIDGQEWQRVVDPLFKYKRTDKVFFENTLPNGNVEIKFGNGIYGAKPAADATMVIRWAEPSMTVAMPETTALVRPTGSSAILPVFGVPVTLLASPTERPPLSYYQEFSRDLHAMAPNKAAHRRADHRAAALSFPGIKDVRFLGQAETNPGKPSWMNVVEVVLLSEPVFSEDQWDAFTAHLESNYPFRPSFIRTDAEAVAVDVVAKVYCHTFANLEEVRQRLLTDVKNLFAPRANKLGYNFEVGDLMAILEGSSGDLKSKISYSRLVSPTESVELDSIKKWVRLASVSIEMYYSTRDYAGRIS